LTHGPQGPLSVGVKKDVLKGHIHEVIIVLLRFVFIYILAVSLHHSLFVNSVVEGVFADLNVLSPQGLEFDEPQVVSSQSTSAEAFAQVVGLLPPDGLGVRSDVEDNHFEGDLVQVSLEELQMEISVSLRKYSSTVALSRVAHVLFRAA